MHCIHYDEDWEKAMHESDPELWCMLTEEADIYNSTEEHDLIFDSDTLDEYENQEIHKPGIPYPSVIHNIDEPDVSIEDIIEIAPAEGRKP